MSEDELVNFRDLMDYEKLEVLTKEFGCVELEQKGNAYGVDRTASIFYLGFDPSDFDHLFADMRTLPWGERQPEVSPLQVLQSNRMFPLYLYEDTKFYFVLEEYGEPLTPGFHQGHLIMEGRRKDESINEEIGEKEKCFLMIDYGRRHARVLEIWHKKDVSELMSAYFHACDFALDWND